MDFETERLILRKFSESDLDAIFEMRSDPDVMRFISDVNIERNETLQWMKKISAKWETDNIGYCAMQEKHTRKTVGWCGLWRLPETDEIEVGYAVSKSSWRKGYATESAKRMVDYGFRGLDLDRIVAVAFPENKASIHVMKKLRMEYVGQGTFYCKQLVQYSVSRDVWLSAVSDERS